MKTDPVTVRVSDEAQAHVGGGVVEVTDEIHCCPAAFGTQQGIQFMGPEDLIGAPL